MMYANFWWILKKKGKNMHWASRDKMCMPNEEGGMSFCDIKCFNQAMLAKQGWCII